jgi:hypothetical protein
MSISVGGEHAVLICVCISCPLRKTKIEKKQLRKALLSEVFFQAACARSSVLAPLVKLNACTKDH